MPDRCAVPGCRSNYESAIKLEGYVRCFRFPKKSDLRNQWFRAIPRSNWSPSDRSVVCIKHFHECQLSYYEKFKDKDRNLCEYKRSQPVLCENAVPKVFPNLPSYLSDTTPSRKRKDPEERREEVNQRERKRREDENRSIEEENNINDFQSFSSLVCSKVNINNWSIFLNYVCCIIYKIDHTNAPKISCSVRINNNLSVEVHVNGGILPNYVVIDRTSNYSICNDGILKDWNQLLKLIEFCDRYEIPNNNTKLLIFQIDAAFERLKSSIDSEDSKNTRALQKLKFLHDQFTLLFSSKPKYNVNTILNAFLIYVQSVKCYDVIRLNNILSLPHPRYLQKLSASFAVSPVSENENTNFLKHITKHLSGNEKIVNLQVDEIHVKQSLDYKNGHLFGVSSNNTDKLANTIVAFLVSSAFGTMKEVIKLIPVKQLKGSELAVMTKNVLKEMHMSDLKTLCILSDNNRINRVMFNILTESSDSKYYFYMESNPLKIFMQYDTVHVFKNIRNNWLNLKNQSKIFNIPFWEGLDKPLEITDSINERHDNNIEATFSDLRTLYDKENGMLVRSAPHLKHASLYPDNFERQKVNLVVDVFNEITVAALSKSGYKGTAYFVKVILMWWWIVNIKRPITYILQNNPVKQPFKEVNDIRFNFLDTFLNWLEKWKGICIVNPNLCCLTKDTHNALYHCTFVLKEIILYSISELKVNYILTAKFQTDNLESTFSKYRELAGGNYNITVTQVLEAEKKL